MRTFRPYITLKRRIGFETHIITVDYGPRRLRRMLEKGWRRI